MAKQAPGSADAVEARRGARPASYTIGALAGAAGVNLETVRYYQRRGLMPQPPRPPGGIRRYGEAEVEQLRFIKRARQVGFTLAEIEQLLSLRTRRSCRGARDLVASKLTDVDARIRDLRQLRRALARWVADCDANPVDSACPVIDRLTLEARQARSIERHATGAN